MSIPYSVCTNRAVGVSLVSERYSPFRLTSLLTTDSISDSGRWAGSPQLSTVVTTRMCHETRGTDPHILVVIDFMQNLGAENDIVMYACIIFAYVGKYHVCLNVRWMDGQVCMFLWSVVMWWFMQRVYCWEVCVCMQMSVCLCACTCLFCALCVHLSV